jgi:preprotein translocase subunit SecB
MADEAAQANQGKQILLEKIYIKDLSFESPRVPEIFGANVQASTQLNLGAKNRKLSEDTVEVTLTLTIESKDNTQTLFLIEVAQAGVFTLKGYSEQERAILLGSFCPGTLYPYAREAVAELAQKGGFPQLLLQPINFDAVYAQALQERQAQLQAASMPVSDSAPAAFSPTGAPRSGETH